MSFSEQMFSITPYLFIAFSAPWGAAVFKLKMGSKLGKI